MSIANVLAWASTTAWAIELRYGRVVANVLRRRALGERLSQDEIDATLTEARERQALHSAAAHDAQQRTGGLVAVLPIVGVVKHRGGGMDDSTGDFAALQAFSQQFRAMDADPNVRSIVLDIDSPGGAIDGVSEAAAMIRGATKPVISVANTMAASAAYWLAAQADELYITPSGSVGSVGVYAMHVDQSVALEQDGIAVSLISAGEFKTEGHPFGPLTEDARGEIQRSVDAAHESFVTDIAAGRGLATKSVRSDFGRGRLVDAKDALASGMVDRIGTLDDAIERAATGGRIGKRGKGAHAESILVSTQAQDTGDIETMIVDRERRERDAISAATEPTANDHDWIELRRCRIAVI